MKRIRIGGVPEHFNLPWRLLLEAQAAAVAEWHDYAQGTGALVAALRDGTLDVAVLLTEGAVAARAADAERSPDAGGGQSDFEIISSFTDTPLIWGIHAPGGSALAHEADIRGKRYAISRRGSGSHLMAVAHARRCGWPLAELRFVEVGTLEGARAAFVDDAADVFFWEKFMTASLVDSGEFRRIGEFVAEWPAFVVCVARSALLEHGGAILTLIEQTLAQAQQLQRSRNAAEMIEARYGLSLEHAREWLSLTRWSDAVGIDRDMLERVADALVDAGVTASP